MGMASTRRSAGAKTRSEESSPADGSSVRALVRGLRILRCFDAAHQAWSFVEVRDQLGLSNATTHRLMKTLESEGFLALDPKTGKYHLGSSMLQAAYLTLSPAELAMVAHPHMEKLAEITGETVDLSIWTEQGPLFVHMVLTSRPFKPPQSVGLTYTDISNASAKVLLAFGPASRRQAVLARPHPKMTEYSIVEPEALSAELDRVVRDGVAYDIQEHVIGICAVSAPVRDSTGEVRAAMTVAYPVERFGPTEMRRAAEALKAAARDLSRELGYREA